MLDERIFKREDKPTIPAVSKWLLFELLRGPNLVPLHYIIINEIGMSNIINIHKHSYAPDEKNKQFFLIVASKFFSSNPESPPALVRPLELL